MASDLIPPPSPAGRPTSPAGTPNLIELPPEPPRSPAQPAQRPTPGPSQYRNRFGFLLGALAGVFIASALVAVAIVAASGDNAPDVGLAKNWSKWQPSDSSTDVGATEIAEHVGAEYKHPNGQQLIKVMAGGLGLPVMLRPASGPISYFASSSGVLYVLNGLGPNGSIKGGTKSAERTELVHREALELALHTFRYLPDVDMVVTLLPPPPPDPGETGTPNPLTGMASSDPSENTATFYRPGDLRPRLEIPLGQTISAGAPTTGGMSSAESKTVEELTQSNVFEWSVAKAQDGSTALILDR